MKLFNKLSLALLILVSIGACKKDESVTGVADGTITATIDGKKWQSTKMATTAGYVDKVLVLAGTDLTGNVINITLSNFNGTPGTFKIPASGNAGENIIVYADGVGSKGWVAPYDDNTLQGEVTITEFSKTGSVKGTFYAKLQSAVDKKTFKEVKNGSFKIKVNSY